MREGDTISVSMTDLQRSHAELRAALMLAGKRIVRLNFESATILCCRFCDMCYEGRAPSPNGMG